jgi:class 3 adenylate cyclase
LKEELAAVVTAILRDRWTSREGKVVPGPENLGLGRCCQVRQSVLYADMADSTKSIDTKTPEFAAEIYRAYLTCAAKIVKANGGVITAYKGDRIMAVFIGEFNTRTRQRPRSEVMEQLSTSSTRRSPGNTHSDYQLRQVIGIDTRPLFIARIGVRNDNDLVWVGRAAHYAAKLSSIDECNTVFITSEVFNKLRILRSSEGRAKRLCGSPGGGRKWATCRAIAPTRSGACRPRLRCQRKQDGPADREHEETDHPPEKTADGGVQEGVLLHHDLGIVIGLLRQELKRLACR